MLLSADGLSKGTRKKNETEMHIWYVSSHPSNWQDFRMRGKNQHTAPRFITALGMGLHAEDLLALRISSPKASSTLCMAEEGQRWKQNSLNSTVVPQRSPAQSSS